MKVIILLEISYFMKIINFLLILFAFLVTVILANIYLIVFNDDVRVLPFTAMHA